MKNKILRINRDESPLKINIYFPKGKTIDDIADVVFLVKTKDSDPLDQSLIKKLLSEGDISLLNQSLVHVAFETADYNGLTVDALYEAALFCKWTGNNDFDENVERLFDFQIEQNFHNDN